MNKLNTLFAALLMLPAIASADDGAQNPEITIKFPIVEKQFPDLQKTVKTPTVVWTPRQVGSKHQTHIISPLFYYQENTEEK